MALTPAFDSAVVSYAARVGHSVTSVTVTATVSDPNATVTIQGSAVNSGEASPAISLAPGSATTINVVVTAQDRVTTKTYRVEVTRANPPPPPMEDQEEPLPATVSIVGPAAPTQEGDAARFEVTLSRPVASDVEVKWFAGSSDDTATGGSDYDPVNGSVIFAVGLTKRTIMVAIIDDELSEPREGFTVTLGTVAGDASIGRESATAVIAASDPLTGITLSASPEAIGEEDGPTSVTITAEFNGGVMRTEATTIALTMEGTATPAEDYSLTGAPPTITISAGRRSQSTELTITPVSDELVEGDETIIVAGNSNVPDLDVTSTQITLTDPTRHQPADPPPPALPAPSPAPESAPASSSAQTPPPSPQTSDVEPAAPRSPALALPLSLWWLILLLLLLLWLTRKRKR